MGYDKIIGQILMSSADVTNEKKSENLINTFNTLLEMGIIPVVNANGSVSYDKIYQMAGGADSRR